jgi:hypothetical protein
MKPPIFLVEPGNIAIYSTVREVESDLQAYGALDPDRFICDATGAAFPERAVNEHRLELSAPEDAPTRAAELAQAIRDHLTDLRRIRKWQGGDDWLAGASLDELVVEFQRTHGDWLASWKSRRSARRARVLAWSLVAMATVFLTLHTAIQAVEQYYALRTGWSWDLAYYNQWFWALTRGDRTITVRPLSSFGVEGPPIWVMNYLAPIRFILAPVYALFPSPITLLLVQNVIFWWVLPATYTLVRSEARSELAAVFAVLLVPLTPILWPLVWNDFRELQLAIPFVLWAAQGVRSRRPGLAGFGLLAMMFCRQEFAIIAATFGFMPARDPEPTARTLRWRNVIVLSSLAWFLFGFFGYLHFVVSASGPEHYIKQLLGPKGGLGETLETSSEFLVFGLGAWTVFMLFAPRVAILAIPWIWQLCSGLWAMRLLEGESWHHVRYAVPATATVLTAGLIGYSRVARWLLDRPRGRVALGACWIAAAGFLIIGDFDMGRRLAKVPRLIDADETAAVWKWIGEVGPEDTVLAAYEVTAPLSSRRRLYSYVLHPNQPRGFPKLAPEFRWVFLSNRDPQPNFFLDQGFKIVHRGPFLTIMRRD